MSGFVDLYKAIKWRKQAKKHEKDYLDSEPPITPGHHGQLPATFTLNLGGFGDANLAYYFVCGPGPQPLFAVSGYTGARLATLHQDINLKSAPLAYVTVPKSGQFNLHAIITVPAPPGSKEAVVNFPFDSSGSVRSPVYQFEAPIAGHESMHVEKFAWQQVGKHERGKPRLFELTGDLGGLGSPERVARWQEEFVPAEGQMANFQLLGSAADGGLGESWQLAAVVSILAIARMEWAAENAADDMVKRGAKVRASYSSITSMQPEIQADLRATLKQTLGQMANMGAGFAGRAF